MANLRMLGHVQVMEDGSGSHDTQLQVLHAEALQVLRLEMFQESIVGSLGGEDPVLQFIGEEAGTEVLLELRPFGPLEEDLLRHDTVQQFIHIFAGALSRQELARGDIQEGNTRHFLLEMDRRKEVVLLVVQYIIIDSDTRRHQLRDATLHQLLSQLRVLQLVADGHTLTRAHQFRQISIQRMMRETGQFDRLGRTVRTLGQRDSQDFGSHHRILQKRLIKIAHTEQQDRIRMHRLEFQVLLHQRRFHYICHVTNNLSYQR